MKVKLALLLLLVAACSAGLTWYLTKHGPTGESPAPSGTSGRRVLYYQSAMHPWIKSDKPGRCTICGMALTPVYEGEQGLAVDEGITTLGSNAIQVIHVQADAVTRRPLQRTLRVAGEINESDARHRIVSAYVDGRIDRLAVNYVGAEVVSGQPLATFYSPALLAAEREYVALLQERPSSGTNRWAAQQDRLTSGAAERLRRLGLSEAQIQALPGKGENESHTELLAPMSGTVVARFVYEGQYVKEGDKLFELADFAILWFVFDAYERDLAWLAVGLKVEVVTPSVPGKTFRGTIAFMDPNLKDMTRSAKVRVELENPLVEDGGRTRRQLYQKLYADGLVHLATPQVLSVPRTAVLMPGAKAVVYVDKGGGSYEQRPVKLGRAGDLAWEILEGLAEGERVVTTGNLLIDAQAQLNQAVNALSGAAEPAPAAAGDAPPLSEAQQKPVQEFLAAASALAAGLAADDVKEFNARAAQVHAAIPALLNAFDRAQTWQPLVEKIEAAGHFEKAGDLKAARRAFLPFTAAVADFAKELRRRQPAFRSLKIYQCPMVDRAVPGGPKVSRWLQLQAPLRNPFFGAEMLDCGTEVPLTP